MSSTATIGPKSGWLDHSIPQGFVDGRARWIYWIGFAAGVAWCLWQMLASRGWLQDDELSHYLISASVWEHPQHLWQSWTRPGRNLFHVIPAHFGLLPARLWTLAWSALAVWWLTRFAQRAGLRSSHWLSWLIWFQPWFVELSWPVLTQGPFFVAFVGGLALHQRGRPALAGLCFGYLATVRHEGIVLSALWGLAVSLEPGGLLHRAFGRWLPWGGLESGWGAALRRDALLALATLAPLLALNLGSWAFTGAMPLQQLLEPKPEGKEEIYGRGTLWHFGPMVLALGGTFLVLLGVAGWREAWRRRAGLWLLSGLAAAWFLTHTLIYWKGLFASGGYYHFLEPVLAPALAVAGVCGLDAIGASGWWRVGLRWLAVAAVTLTGLLLLHRQIDYWPAQPGERGVVLLGHQLRVRRLQLFGPVLRPADFETAILDACRWVDANRPEAPLRCAHVAAAYARPGRPAWNEYGDVESVERVLPVDGLFLYEPKYAAEHYQVTTRLLERCGYEPIRDFGAGVVLWERREIR